MTQIDVTHYFITLSGLGLILTMHFCLSLKHIWMSLTLQPSHISLTLKHDNAVLYYKRNANLALWPKVTFETMARAF